MTGAAPTILSVDVVHDGWAKFLKASVRLADGTEAKREIEAHGDAVAVLPYDPERRVLIVVSLFRAPALYAGGGPNVIEAIAGLIDGGEQAREAVRREAMEEAGVQLDTLERIAKVWASPGISTEQMTLYLASYAAAARIGLGGGVEGEHEGITVLEIPIAEAWRMLANGQIADMKTLALLFALKLRRPDLFEAVTPDRIASLDQRPAEAVSSGF